MKISTALPLGGNSPRSSQPSVNPIEATDLAEFAGGGIRRRRRHWRACPIAEGKRRGEKGIQKGRGWGRNLHRARPFMSKRPDRCDFQSIPIKLTRRMFAVNRISESLTSDEFGSFSNAADSQVYVPDSLPGEALSG